MPTWDYDANQYSKEDFVLIPEGEYRVKIEEAREKMSKTDKEMIVLKLKVLDHANTLYYNLVFDPDKPGMVNQNLGRIYDSFNITENDMCISNWEGRIGAAKVTHREYQGKPQASVYNFLTRERQVELGFMTQEFMDFNTAPQSVRDDMTFGFKDGPGGEGDADIPF